MLSVCMIIGNYKDYLRWTTIQIVSQGFQDVMGSIQLFGTFFQFVFCAFKRQVSGLDPPIQIVLEVAETVAEGLLQPTDCRERQRTGACISQESLQAADKTHI